MAEAAQEGRADPMVRATRAGAEFALSGAGEWTLPNAEGLEAQLDEAARQAAGAATATIDMAGVVRFDTYGAWLLERFRRQAMASGAKVSLSGISGRDRPLIDKVAGLNREEAARKPRRRLADLPAELSAAAAALMRDAASFSVTTGALVAAAGRTLADPRRFRLTATVSQFDRVGWLAVPIIVMITFLIGAILAQQGFFHFRRFGADLYVVDMIGFLIMRELGVLLVAIMVAGRTGSAFTAELGSMKMREEVDALRTMGLDPVEILILPRILVLVVAMPVLTFIGSMAALFGAGLVATLYAGLGVELFLDRLRDAITMDHFLVGIIKAPFIGFVIGVIACNEGLATQGSAASLGRQTTQSVVKAIFMVIFMDGLFALFFSGISM